MRASKNTFIRTAGLVLLAVTLLLGSYQSTNATEIRGGPTVVVGAEEVIADDLFVSGERIEINGVVEGNLFAAGTEITINGHVEGSIFIAGRTLAVNGKTDGSVYAGGYEVTMGPEASVGRNIHFGGYSLTTQPNSEIGRSLYGGGYQLILGGDVANDVNIGAIALELAGDVGGDVIGDVANPEQNTEPFFVPPFEGSVTTVEPGLRVSEEANIGGDLNVVIEAADDSLVAPPFFSIANPIWRWAAGEFIALLLMGILLLAVWPTLLERTSSVTKESWLPSTGMGLLGLILVVLGVPLLLIALILVTILAGMISFGQLASYIIGLGIGTLIFAVAIFVFTVTTLTKIIVAYAGGRLCMEWLGSSTAANVGANTNMTRFFALAVGLFVYVLLRSIPFGIGGVIGFIVILMGLGAIYFTYRGERRPAPASMMPPMGTPSEIPA